MSDTHSTLGIELRFWPNSRPSDWQATFAALWSWDPALHPQAFQVTSGEGWEIPDDRPWDEEQAAQLVRLCTNSAAFSWFLGNDSGHHLQCSGRESRISIAIQVPVPAVAIVDHYVDLLDRLPASNRPELGLLFDFVDVEVAYNQEGLRRLRYVPPVLHFGPRAIAKLGGRDKVRQTPCEVRDTPGGGLLLIVRPDPFGKATKEDQQRTIAVAAFLGISEETPLTLMEES